MKRLLLFLIPTLIQAQEPIVVEEQEVQSVKIQTENIENSLREIPGLQVFRDPHRGGLQLSLRGSRVDHVNVYLDDYLLGQNSGQALDLATLPVDSIEEVLIYKDSVPLQYLSAPGGVIVFKTKKDLKLLKVTAGSFETYRVHLTTSAKINSNWSYRINLDGEMTENNYPYLDNNGTPLNSSDDFNAKRENAARSHYSIAPQLKYQKGEDQIEWKGLWWDHKQELPALSQSSMSEAYFWQKHRNQEIKWSRQLDDHSFQFWLSRQELEQSFVDPLASLGNTPLEQVSQLVSYPIYGLYSKSFSDFVYSVKVYGQRDDVTQTELGQRDQMNRTQWHFSNELGYERDQWSLSLQLTQKQYRDRGLVENDASGAEGAFSVTRKWGLLRLNLQVQSLLRFPQIWQVQGQNGFQQSNPDLRPERSENLSLNLSYHQSELSFFQKRLKDAIVFNFNSLGVGVAQNLEEVQIRGVELAQSWQLGQWQQKISYSYQIAENQTAGPLQNKRMPNLFERQLNILTQFHLADEWVIGHRYLYSAHMFFDDANLLPADDLQVHTIELSYVRTQHRLQLSLENLLDRPYQSFNGLPGPGRIWYFSYQWLF